MQRGEISPENLKDDHKKIVPKTLDEKCENFLFYHKYKLMFAAVAAVVLTIIIISMIRTPKYDTTVTIYCYEYVDEATISDTDSWMEKIFPDVNGNGQVDVLVADCSFSADSDLADTVHQRQLKMQTILTDPESMLFILDDESLEYLNGITDSFVLFKEENIVELKENYYSSLSGDRASFKDQKPRYLCLRTVEGSALEGKAEEQYKAAKETLEKIRANQ
jgi:hypothetical protein